MEATRRYQRSWLFIGIAIIFSFLFSITALADNRDVKDTAQVLSERTEQYIYDVNQDQMGKIKGHPQIAVYTVDGIEDGDIDSYSQELFDKYKFGTKGYDNGVLLLIDTKDHKIRMQTGYGMEAAVPDDYVNTLMDDQVKGDFRNDDYSAGTQLMVKMLADRITSHQDELRSKSDVNDHRAAQERIAQQQARNEAQMTHLMKTVAMAIVLGLIAIVLLAMWLRIHKKNKIYTGIDQEFEKAREEINRALRAQGISYLISARLLTETMRQDYFGEVDDYFTGSTFLETAVLMAYLDSDILPEMMTWCNLWVLDRINQHKLSVHERLMIKALDQPLDNYQRMADRLNHYREAIQQAQKDINGLTEADYEQFDQARMNTFNQKADNWKYLQGDSFKSNVNQALGETSQPMSLAAYKDGLMDMLINQDFQSELMNAYLDKQDNEPLLTSMRAEYAKQDIDTAYQKLDEYNNVEHEREVDREFSKHLDDTGVYDRLTARQQDELNDLDIETKENALQQVDSLLLFDYLQDQLSDYEDDHDGGIDSDWDDDNDDDDNNWFDGGGSGFGGGDFGGDGGFSGGGGGDASW